MITNNINNVLDCALVDRIYNDIKTLNECSLNCDFRDISLLVYKSTDIAEVSMCDVLAFDVVDILCNAGLLVFDNGFKVLPVL